MVRHWIVVFALFGCIGCDKEVRRETVRVWEHDGTTSCYYSGVCVTCGPMVKFDGTLGVSCGLGMSVTCLGTQPARLRSFTEHVTYESGKTNEWVTSVVIARMGDCS